MSLLSRKRDKKPEPLKQAHIRRLVADSALATVALDGDGRVLVANEACTVLLGWSEEELLTVGFLDRVHARDAQTFGKRFCELINSRCDHLRGRQRLVRKSGEPVWCQVSGHRIPVGTPMQQWIVLTLEDISIQIQVEQERWDTEAELAIQRGATSALAGAATAEDALASLLQSTCETNGWSLGLFWMVDEDGAVLRCTHSWHGSSVEAQLFVNSIRQRPLTPQGGPPSDAWQQGMPVWVTDMAQANRSIHVGKAQDAGLSSAVCVPVLLQSGVYGVMEFLSWEPREEREAITRALVAISRQVGRVLERIWDEHPLREREARYRAIAEMAGEAIITIDEESTIQFANAATERVFGYTRAELIGQNLSILIPEGLRASHRAGMMRYLETGRRRLRWENLEFPALHKNGTQILLQMSLAEVGDGQRRAFTGFMRDISEQKREESALLYQAMHDALTDLPNRSLLQERLSRAVLVAHRHHTPLALLFMDLDRFKDVNDTFGHHCGDQILQHVARRLMRTLRESDTVARLGGDEFAILLPTTDDRGAVLTAERVLDALKEPFEIESQRFDIGASVGIAFYPQHGGDTATLMRRADVAMYAAKRKASGFSVYSSDNDEMSALRLRLKSELRHAIESNQLVLYYQPKVNLTDGQTENVEALIRWQHPERGLTSPDGFISLAEEETWLIKPLTMWVLNEALRQHCVWRQQGLDLRMAVNFSARVLHDADLMSLVTAALETWKVEPSRLEVEITESAIMVDPEGAKHTLTALHSAGILTSIDDFGTGHSSLAYLRQLPFDEIKIDKSFVLDMATSRDDASIVRSVIALGHNFDLQVVAEGVDNQRTLDMLGKMGCDIAQGFFLSRPIAAADLYSWVTDPKRRLSIAS